MPVLMVRRSGSPRADFVACFSAGLGAFESVPVTKADGSPANALGVKVALKDGKTFHALVNYEAEGTEVVLGELKTTARFATDYEKP
ncbi:MAG: hypothetical protein M5U26_08545 [Planctomycetota bacterium]|nr:hypothetical protein [Planctomycetota bacterium]